MGGSLLQVPTIKRSYYWAKQSAKYNFWNVTCKIYMLKNLNLTGLLSANGNMLQTVKSTSSGGLVPKKRVHIIKWKKKRKRSTCSYRLSSNNFEVQLSQILDPVWSFIDQIYLKEVICLYVSWLISWLTENCYFTKGVEPHTMRQLVPLSNIEDS